jgi:pilus assembly protein CpaC
MRKHLVSSRRSLAAPAALALVLSSSTFVLGQAPAVPAPAPPAPAAPAAQAGDVYPKVNIITGRSTVIPTEFDVTRIAITNPTIADAVVVQPREILIDGKAPGTVSLIVWGTATRSQYDVVVEQPTTNLEQQIHMLFPGEDVTVGTSEGATILSGRVSNTNVMLRIGEIAQASMPKAQVINLLQVPGGSESQQVMLQVRFAEVNRRLVSELGLNLFVARDRFLARSTTQQFSAPGFEGGGPLEAPTITFSDFLNIFFFDREEGIGGVLKALEQNGAFQSLAEPNLIAYNNQEASFLAGGEFPVPVVSGAAGTVSVTYKEFGIRLNFTPTIAGDVIRLKVRPEVSTLDFVNGVTLSGFRIPALTTRRAETVAELRDGQSFAIAGLLDNVSQTDAAAIPILSKLPIIGAIFKSRTKRAEQTELMVLITPRLVRALDPDEVPSLPTVPDSFIRRPTEGTKPPPDGSARLEGGSGLVDAPLAPAQSAKSSPVDRPRGR